MTLPLIATEYLLLPLARWFDRRAEPHHAAGIPVLTAAFVALGALPPVAAGLPLNMSLAPDARLRRAVNRQLRKTGSDTRISSVPALVEAELVRLSCHATDAMRRHALESVRRLVTIVGPLEIKASLLHQPSPAPLLRRLLRLHLWILPWADWLDDRARPLQYRGIPVLTNDLPRIPAWPAEWSRPDAA